MDRETVVLLGAGAAAEAGVPTTFDMTDQLVEAIGRQSPRSEDRGASALHFICAALMAYDAAEEGISPFVGLDVERVFAAVELLSERWQLEVAPFVSSWHPAVDAWDETPNRSPHRFDDKLVQILEGRIPGSAERLISELIVSYTASSATGDTYARLRDRMLSALRDLVATTPKDVAYLEPLITQGNRPGGLTIASLNYDLAIEQAADSAGVPVTNGIKRWLEEGRWEWPVQGIRLLKLHGSVDWVWDYAEHTEGQLPRSVVTVTNDPANDARKPALVFGQRKLRAEGPFLGLLAEFESHLAEAQRLIVIGYSFRDDHVNEVIRRWTAEDIDRTILTVDPAWADYPASDFKEELMTYLIPSLGDDGKPTFPRRLDGWALPCSDAVTKLAGAGFVAGR